VGSPGQRTDESSGTRGSVPAQVGSAPVSEPPAGHKLWNSGSNHHNSGSNHHNSGSNHHNSGSNHHCRDFYSHTGSTCGDRRRALRVAIHDSI